MTLKASYIEVCVAGYMRQHGAVDEALTAKLEPIRQAVNASDSATCNDVEDENLSLWPVHPDDVAKFQARGLMLDQDEAGIWWVYVKRKKLTIHLLTPFHNTEAHWIPRLKAALQSFSYIRVVTEELGDMLAE